MNTPLELFAHVLTFFALVACGEQVAWPTVVKKFLSYMSVFYFDLNLTAPEVTYAPPPPHPPLPPLPPPHSVALLAQVVLSGSSQFSCSFNKLQETTVCPKWSTYGGRGGWYTNTHTSMGFSLFKRFCQVHEYPIGSMFSFLSRSCACSAPCPTSPSPPSGCFPWGCPWPPAPSSSSCT